MPFLISGFFAILVTSVAVAQTPLGTYFTFQGQLEDAGILANGEYDIQAGHLRVRETIR